MKKIFTLAAIIAVAISLASCGATKRFKHEQKQSASIDIKSDYDSTSHTKAKVETETKKKATVKTTETIDTNIVVPGSSVSAKKPLEEITKGKPLVVDVNGHSFSIRYNPGTGNIDAESTVSDRTVPVHAKRVTEAETEEEGTTKAQTENKAAVSASEAAKGETDTSEVIKTSETKATPWYFAPWPWIILFVIGAAAYLKYGSPIGWITSILKRKT